MSNDNIDPVNEDLDAEGHVVRGRGLDDGSGDGTQGHMPLKRGLDDGSGDTDDADGHVVRGRGLDDESGDDDAEGLGRPKIPGKPNRRA